MLKRLERPLGFRKVGGLFGSLSEAVLRDAQVDHRLIELLELRELRHDRAERFDGRCVLFFLEQACSQVMLSFVLSRIVGVLSQEGLPLVAGQFVQLLILKTDCGGKLTRRGFGLLGGRRVNDQRRRREPDQNRQC